MELSQPFVRLPFSFNSEQLQAELAQFGPSDWQEHPNKIAGNSAIPLVSLNGKNNNDFSGRMLPTAHLQRCEYIQQVMASFGEVVARSRLMRLDAGAEVTPHVDFNYHWYSRVRIHIPVVTNPDVIFHCGDEQVHMKAGESWIFDSWRKHNVINSGVEDRVHLVMDIAGSSRFWGIVRKMEQYDIGTPQSDTNTEHVPYTPGEAVQIKTERYNVAPVMAPGELESIAKELITDFKHNPKNAPEIINEYETLLNDLSKDWREIWHLYGYEREGWKHYKALLDRTARQLRPNPRVLVTASNDVGVNPIIMQRILRAALNLKQIELFKTV